MEGLGTLANCSDPEGKGECNGNKNETNQCGAEGLCDCRLRALHSVGSRSLQRAALPMRDHQRGHVAACGSDERNGERSVGRAYEKKGWTDGGKDDKPRE